MFCLSEGKGRKSFEGYDQAFGKAMKCLFCSSYVFGASRPQQLKRRLLFKLVRGQSEYWRKTIFGTQADYRVAKG